MVFEQDGKTLLVRNDLGDCWAYKDDPGQEPARLAPRMLRYNFEDLPDKRWVATGFGQRRGTMGMGSSAFSPDGRYAVTTASLGRILIWEAPGEKGETK